MAVDKSFQPGLFSGTVSRKIVHLEADVRDSNKASEAVGLCVKEFGRFDILVNNAGFIKGGSIFDYKEDEWDRLLAVNLGGYRNFARAAANRMVKDKTNGRIVNVSSVDGVMGEPGILAYSASKAAIIIFTKCLAIELAPHGIRVNSVGPGWVDTPMGGELLDAKSRKVVNDSIPLGYIAPPEEIARVIVFLSSEMSQYMTGSLVMADGGQTSDISVKGLQY